MKPIEILPALFLLMTFTCGIIFCVNFFVHIVTGENFKEKFPSSNLYILIVFVVLYLIGKYFKIFA